MSVYDLTTFEDDYLRAVISAFISSHDAYNLNVWSRSQSAIGFGLDLLIGLAFKYKWQ
jgi:hypothetical protein